jgi:WS/DGAT/MGAT family acyltransferase
VDPTAPLTRGGLASGAGEAVPGALRLLGEAAVHLAGAPLRMARTAGHLARATARLAGVVRRGEDGALALPLTAPRTSLNRRISTRRGFAFCSLPLTPVKEAARREGVKVNDVVLALVSGALRRYLDAPGELPARSLVAAVPVGLPDDGAAGQVGGNRWAVVLASLASDLADPEERLHRIAASARTGKRAQQAIGSDLWHELFDVPPLVWDVIARGYVGLHLADAHPAVVNVVVSNLRGAPFPLYTAGARLLANYPMGPIADGLGLNITVISYLDSLDVGLTVCPDLVEDPWLLVEAFHAEVDELARRYPEQAPGTVRTPAGPLVPTRRPGPGATVGT